MNRDRAIALQRGNKSETPSQKKKERKKERNSKELLSLARGLKEGGGSSQVKSPFLPYPFGLHVWVPFHEHSHGSCFSLFWIFPLESPFTLSWKSIFPF